MMWRYWKIVLVAGSVVAAIAAFSHWRWQAGFNEAEGKWQQRWSQRDADDATALAKRQTEARNKEQRRQSEINEIRERAAQQLALVQADASTARAAADRLQNSAEILARRLADRERACGAGTPGRSEAKTSGTVLLADLFRRADDRAVQLAKEADEARARGLACESAYEALRRDHH